MSVDVNLHVGRRLRNRRIAMDMSQKTLGDVVDVGFQQIQKYESGKARLSPEFLWHFSEKLNIPVSYFFDGLAEMFAAEKSKDSNAAAK